MKAVILKNELNGYQEEFWKIACEKNRIDYEIIDLMSDSWLTNISASDGDFFLACLPGLQEHYKVMYDEKIYWIEKVLKKKVYPSYSEIYVYENKRNFSYFAQILGLPIPETHVFYSLEEANEFLYSTRYPIVAKTNIGASGSGVEIIRTRKAAEKYTKQAFTKGIKRKSGPNLQIASRRSLLKRAIQNPKLLIERLKFYKKIGGERQTNFVIFQEYIHHDFEWRIVKVGDSYFGHKKLKIGEKASGTKAKSYDVPPVMLLDFVDSICQKCKFNMVAVDIFERADGNYYINEMQTQWGQKYDYLMLVDGKAGRFMKQKDGNWFFEEGDFNQNKSFNLRLKWILQQNE